MQRRGAQKRETEVTAHGPLVQLASNLWYLQGTAAAPSPNGDRGQSKERGGLVDGQQGVHVGRLRLQRFAQRSDLCLQLGKGGRALGGH